MNHIHHIHMMGALWVPFSFKGSSTCQDLWVDTVQGVQLQVVPAGCLEWLYGWDAAGTVGEWVSGWVDRVQAEEGVPSSSSPEALCGIIGAV